MNQVAIKTIDNGLKIGVDTMKEVDTVTVVFGTGIGARDEDEAIYIKSLLTDVYKIKKKSINMNSNEISFKSKTIASILRNYSDICRINNDGRVSFSPILRKVKLLD